MRTFVAWLVALGLAVSPAMARTHGEGDEGSAADKKSEKAAATDKTAAAAKTDAPAKSKISGLEVEFQQLKKLVESQAAALQEQQRRMAALEEELRAARSASAAVSSASSASPTVTNVGMSRQPAAVAGTARGSEAAPQPAPQNHKGGEIEVAEGKLRIGGMLFSDYAYYTKAGFGPQFLTQINQPGPGNNGYNSFDISRAYINLFYSPSDAVTFRLTPNIYRQIGAAPASKVGKVSAIGANTDGELGFRLKYAYVDFNTPFENSEAFKKDKLTVGQQPNPFVDWEENLYGYRWTSLVPWNYLSLSSAQTGIKVQGPIEFNGKQYLDYSIGVFTNASFRQLEQSEKKQAMARLTVYPFGAKSNYDGLGFTGFYNYGYKNVAPDTAGFPLYRVAALAHYTFSKNAYGIAGEFDLGRNTFNSGNFFSGSGPQDEFGVASTKAPTGYATWDALVQALQNGNGTKQKGYATFGHAQIPGTPLTLFGMYHYFMPNTQVAKNPLDFHRIVAGVSYKVNARLRFALTSQNLVFKHSQFTFPASDLAQFSPSLAAVNPNGIPNAVPNRVQAVFANVELNF